MKTIDDNATRRPAFLLSLAGRGATFFQGHDGLKRGRGAYLQAGNGGLCETHSQKKYCVKYKYMQV
jgi:hypothetical protein